MLLLRTALGAARARLGGYRGSAIVALWLLLITLTLGTRSVRADQTLRLPFPGGVSAQIIQGYNGGTHTGVERYSLDLVRVDGNTAGSSVLASASGTVAFAQLPASQNGCIGVAMDNSGDFHYMLCHIILDHVYSYGDRVQAGQILGTVGPPGQVGNNGTAHIHMQLYTLPNQQRTPVPFAPPNGMALDTVAMPAGSDFNQWACAGSSCHLFLSSNTSASGTTLAAANPAATAASVQSNAAGSQPGAALTASLAAGRPAVVQGTGDCLRTHAQPRMEAATTGCAPDGTVVSITDGPQTADGRTWWLLMSLGWSVADYLRPAPAAAGPAAPPAATATALPSPSAGSAVASAGLSVGTLIRVTGTGDCLRLHSEPSLTAPSSNCLPDGTVSAIKAGPRSADGHQWWLVDAGGWAAGEYLQAVPYS